MGTRAQGGAISQPAVNYQFKLYTPNSNRLPRDGFGLESIDGFLGGNIEMLKYGEGNELFIGHFAGDATYDNLKCEKAFDGTLYVLNWWEQCRPHSDTTLRTMAGSQEALGLSIYDDVVIQMFERARLDKVILQVRYPSMWVGTYAGPKLERKGSSDIARETFTLCAAQPYKIEFPKPRAFAG